MSVMKKKRDIADVLTDIRIARNRLRIMKTKIEGRLTQQESLSRSAVLTKEYIKEAEQLKKISEFLDTLDIILELIEIKVETIIYIGYIVNDAPAVLEALRELKKNGEFLSPELSALVDDIYNGFYSAINVPSEIKVSASKEAKKVLDEAKTIAKYRESGKNIDINT
ncbi:hypothetical protein DDW13_04655 [Acidianus hospitalis]|jgi:division protein CdvB (Snf7/Vps24/ESCRT-III family)|uniref:Uncharacterized protein n=2 Tax=Acidianus hospitalis TaxID=563177 RepID=A0A2T9X6G9_9CREN|nr:hypothetical protein DDW13_04655 [Acidianus hospitalis]